MEKILLKKVFRYIGWTIVLSISLYFVLENVLPYFIKENGFSPDMIPFKPSFLIHLLLGTLMISIAPLQFISQIRKRHIKVHRILGLVYVLSVLISGIVALYIAVVKMIITEKLITFGVGLFGLGIASLITTLTAYWMIKKKKYEQHREWMVRSYVVTLGFATFRLFTDIFNGTLMHVNRHEMANIMSWACWSVPLLITEFFLQVNKTQKIKRHNK